MKQYKLLAVSPITNIINIILKCFAFISGLKHFYTVLVDILEALKKLHF